MRPDSHNTLSLLKRIPFVAEVDDEKKKMQNRNCEYGIVTID